MSQDQFNDIEKELDQFETEFEGELSEDASLYGEKSEITVQDDFTIEKNVNDFDERLNKESSETKETEDNYNIPENIEKHGNERTVVNINFPHNSTSIKQTIMATGQRDNLLAANGQLRLIMGRQYYVPVDTNVDSDNYEHIKLFSDVSDKIEIRYVKDGYACLYPLISRVILHDKQRLCVLIGD